MFGKTFDSFPFPFLSSLSLSILFLGAVVFLFFFFPFRVFSAFEDSKLLRKGKTSITIQEAENVLLQWKLHNTLS